MKRAFNHILYNHRVVKDDFEHNLQVASAFKVGDFFIENLRAQADDIWFWERHCINIMQALALLDGTLDENINIGLRADLHRLIRSNRAFTYTHIEIVFFRNQPIEANVELSKTFSYWAKLTPASTSWVLNETGLVIDVYNRYRKLLTPVAKLNTSPSYWPKQQAKLFMQRIGLDDCIILNQEGDFCETVFSNVFIVRNKNVYTPALETGCRQDVMREIVIHALSALGFNVVEAHFSDSELLLNAEEVFLTDIENGIRTVAVFQTSRYVRRVAAQLLAFLNNRDKK